MRGVSDNVEVNGCEAVRLEWRVRFMGFGATLLLIVLGAWLGSSLAIWQADRRKRLFFMEMSRRQIESGLLIPNIWANCIIKSNA